MKRLYFIILLLLSLNSHGQINNNQEIYRFESFPSFHKGFELILNGKLNTIEFIEKCDIMFIDSIEPDGFAYSLDSIKINSIFNFAPSLFKITVNVSHKEYLMFKSIIDSLIILTEKNNNDEIGPEDGITFYITKNSNKAICINSPYLFTEQGKLIINLFILIENKFNNIYLITNLFDNSRYYISGMPFYIRNFEPLYIKFHEEIFIGSSFESYVEKLPQKNEIILDVTNSKSINEKGMYTYVDSIFRNKYKSINWISKTIFWKDIK